jgi:hypothetical protein
MFSFTYFAGGQNCIFMTGDVVVVSDADEAGVRSARFNLVEKPQSVYFGLRGLLIALFDKCVF